MTISFALLGAGRIGKVHASAVAQNPSARLAAVYDPFESAAQSIAAQYGCAVQELDAIAQNDQIDAVLICTPTNTHADLIEKFAHAGKAIFCEKPIDLSVERVNACLKVVSKTSTPLMIGFNRRFDPHFQAVRHEIEQGKIGEVEQVVITSRDPAPPPIDYIKVSGGIFRDMMIHDFDMARFLLGEEIQTIFATGSSLVDPEIGQVGDFDTAMAILTTASGKQCVINNSRRASYGYDQRIEVHGSKGMVRAHNPRPLTHEIANDTGYQSAPLHDFFMTRYMEAYAAEIQSMIKAMSEKQPLHPSGQDGLAALVLADAASVSALEGRPIQIGSLL